jgi:hypothetical protein
MGTVIVYHGPVRDGQESLFFQIRGTDGVGCVERTVTLEAGKPWQESVLESVRQHSGPDTEIAEFRQFTR